MEQNQEQETNQNQNQNDSNSKQEKIQKQVGSTKEFTEETKQRITFAPNVTTIIQVPKDWYMRDYEDLKNQQGAEYAEKNFVIKKEIRINPNDPDKSYPQYTYKNITLPNTSFPNLKREARITSSKANEAIINELARVSRETDSDILLTITKKQGDTIYKVNWEVQGQAAPTTNH